MRISVEITALPGVEGASLMIGSDSNKRILEEAGLLTEPGRGAGPDDLIIRITSYNVCYTKLLRPSMCRPARRLARGW